MTSNQFDKKAQAWSALFSEPMSDLVKRYTASVSFDQRLWSADIQGSLAHAEMLAAQGIISAQDHADIQRGMAQIRAQIEAGTFDWQLDLEDVHLNIEARLTQLVGDAGKRLHTGRSRNEQVSLDVRLWIRNEIDRASGFLTDLMQSLLDCANKYPDAVIPGYTHLRRAQAVLWPHYLLAYFEMFARDQERLQQARGRVNVLPLGSGALAGSGFPFDREAIARDLGFGAITRNSMDVSADRDFALDFLFAASTTLIHLSRLAEDWILYSSEEFGWIELGDGVTSGSSLMPQKKNPDSLELIRGKCGRVIGDLNALLVTMKGLPTTYNRDMQEDKEPIFDAAYQLSGCLEMARGVVDSMVLRPEKPAAAADESWVVATDFAEALARAGTPFHKAHQLAGKLVLESLKAGKKPQDWTPEEIAAFSPEFTADMAKLLYPKEGMKTRALRGGTAPAAVAVALAEAQARLNQMRS